MVLSSGTVAVAMTGSSIFEDLGAAYEAAQDGDVVVRLEGFARWLVVPAAEAAQLGRVCGWVVEP